MVVIRTTLVYHFVDPCLGVDIFFEKGGNRIMGLDFEVRC